MHCFAKLVKSGRSFKNQLLVSRGTGQVPPPGWVRFQVSDNGVYQDPAHEIAGLEYLFANKKDFGGDDNARQKLGSVLI
jgi:hypothetical protein